MGEVGPAATSFVVRALRNGSVVTIGWSAGTFDGDPPTVDLVEMEAEMIITSRTDPHLGYIPAGEIGVGSLDDAVGDPVVAFALVDRVVDRVIEVAVNPSKEPI